MPASPSVALRGRVAGSPRWRRWPSGAVPGRCPDRRCRPPTAPTASCPNWWPATPHLRRTYRAVCRGEVLDLQARVAVAERQRDRAVVDGLRLRPRRAVRGDLHDVRLRVRLLPGEVDPVEGLRGAEVDTDPLVVLVGGGPAGVRIAVGDVGRGLLVLTGAGGSACACSARSTPGRRCRRRPASTGRTAPGGGPGQAPDADVPGLLPAEARPSGCTRRRSRVNGSGTLVLVAELPDTEAGGAPVALRPSAEAVSVRSCRCGSPSPLGHHSFGLRSRARGRRPGRSDVGAPARRHGDRLGHPHPVEGRGHGRRAGPPSRRCGPGPRRSPRRPRCPAASAARCPPAGRRSPRARSTAAAHGSRCRPTRSRTAGIQSQPEAAR